MNTRERKAEFKKLLRDKEYRDAFVSAAINVGIPSQIRALREQKDRDWSQGELGDKANMAQESISRIEDPSRGSVNNIKTLLRLASAFDVGLLVKFVPFSELIERKLTLSIESLEVQSFDKDPYFQEKDDMTVTTDIATEAIIIGQLEYDLTEEAVAEIPTSEKTSGNVISIQEYLEKTYAGYIDSYSDIDRIVAKV